ncbi:hypothetical protein ACODG7_17075 [Vibrio anguillarum]|uniref:hypothetical protein n=1 Tax=Vibrio anguillarum TaxID=55601 RepID=UPI0002EDE661
MLGGRLDAEGYFAAKLTTKSNSTRSRNDKYVMIIYCLSSAGEHGIYRSISTRFS